MSTPLSVVIGRGRLEIAHEPAAKSPAGLAPERAVPAARLQGRRASPLLEVSEATYHRWRAQYGGMKADDVKRLASHSGGER